VLIGTTVTVLVDEQARQLRVIAPVSGEVIAINDALSDTPELLNSDPYGEAWLFRIKPSDSSELDKLLNAEGYQASL